RWCRFAPPPATGCHPSGMECGDAAGDGRVAGDGLRHERARGCQAGVLDMAAFDGILRRHGLSAAWQRFQDTFLNDSP
ncbi:MAG: hypothetical protein ACKOEQ_00540, partial [Verrucomicrobiota bacterium]